MKKRGRRSSSRHSFGGSWTDTKLELVAEYLGSYTKVMKRSRFVKGYIDALAGTGYRDPSPQGADDPGAELPFPDLAADEPQALLSGSARLALMTEPPFDRYVFIERSPLRCRQLEALEDEFPSLANNIQIREGDANVVIQDLCTKDWSSRRAVLFLDPYGMQVEWATIERIAATKAIDLWVLFPLGMGVNRLLKKSGAIPDAWRRRLDLLLGTTDWYDAFYSVRSTPTLFDDSQELVVKASTEVIGRFFNQRLRSVFSAVAEEPRVLRNSKRVPLYLLCFAAGNPTGAPIAVKIANHLLRRGTD